MSTAIGAAKHAVYKYRRADAPLREHPVPLLRQATDALHALHWLENIMQYLLYMQKHSSQWGRTIATPPLPQSTQNFKGNSFMTLDKHRLCCAYVISYIHGSWSTHMAIPLLVTTS
jgi:hypothetical protein